MDNSATHIFNIWTKNAKMLPLLCWPNVSANLVCVRYMCSTDYVWEMLSIFGALSKPGLKSILGHDLGIRIHNGNSSSSSKGEKAEELLKRLEEEGKALIILNSGITVYSSKEAGLAGLLKATEEADPFLLNGSIVADRVVGKAAALVAISFGAREVHAIVMSRPATDVLRRNSKIFSCINLVDEIKDKSGHAVCKFERMVYGIDDPKEAVRLLKEALK